MIFYPMSIRQRISIMLSFLVWISLGLLLLLPKEGSYLLFQMILYFLMAVLYLVLYTTRFTIQTEIQHPNLYKAIYLFGAICWFSIFALHFLFF